MKGRGSREERVQKQTVVGTDDGQAVEGACGNGIVISEKEEK